MKNEAKFKNFLEHTILLDKQTIKEIEDSLYMNGINQLPETKMLIEYQCSVFEQIQIIYKARGFKDAYLLTNCYMEQTTNYMMRLHTMKSEGVYITKPLIFMMEACNVISDRLSRLSRIVS